MTTTLHITNGDGAASCLKASPIEGDVLPWRDTMHAGPFPEKETLAEASKLRAQYLAGGTLKLADVERDFEIRDAHLSAAGTYREVILWFEHDLLDQLQILQLLDWFKKASLEETSLSMVCINEFQGISPFYGLGQLTSEQIATLIPSIKPVTTTELELAAKGWAAFRSSNPQILLEFIKSDLYALPFLKPALERLLEEYPSTENGLNKTQNKILGFVAEGITMPDRIFKNTMESETVFFTGDWAHFTEVSRLTNGEHPLLNCEPDKKFHHPRDMPAEMEKFKEQKLNLTELGEKVLSNQTDAVQLLELDQWFGGVHLKYDKPIWLWDKSTEQLLIKEPR